MAREFFEFHCAVSGQGCGGYFHLHLDTEEDRKVIMQCPYCGHKHQRYFYEGKITDTIKGRPERHGVTEDTDEVHLIEVPKSAYSLTPMLRALEEKGFLGSLWSRIQ
jgi:hypothetical protein